MRPKDICNMVPYLCGLTNAKKRSWVVLESSQHFVVFKPKQFEQISDVISCKDIRNRIITVNRNIWPKEDRGIWNLKLFCFFSSYARSVGGITQLLWCGWVLSNVLFSYACAYTTLPTTPYSTTLANKASTNFVYFCSLFQYNFRSYLCWKMKGVSPLMMSPWCTHIQNCKGLGYYIQTVPQIYCSSGFQVWISML